MSNTTVGITGDIDSASDWQEFRASDYTGNDINLRDPEGRCARMIVMVDAGDLLVENARGSRRHLHGLPAGYVHLGYCSMLSAGQTAGIVVYW